jgi:hypothetical protein
MRCNHTNHNFLAIPSSFPSLACIAIVVDSLAVVVVLQLLFLLSFSHLIMSDNNSSTKRGKGGFSPTLGGRPRQRRRSSNDGGTPNSFLHSSQSPSYLSCVNENDCVADGSLSMPSFSQFSGFGDDDMDDAGSTVASVRGNNELFAKYLPLANNNSALDERYVFESSLLDETKASVLDGDWKLAFVEMMNGSCRSAILSIGKNKLVQSVNSLTVETAKWEQSGVGYQYKKDERKCQLESRQFRFIPQLVSLSIRSYLINRLYRRTTFGRSRQTHRKCSEERPRKLRCYQ